MSIGRYIVFPGYVLASMLTGSLATVVAGEPAAASRNISDAKPKKLLVFVGTYTSGKSKGIYSYHLDLDSGALTPIGVAPSVNPSFVAIDPSHRYLYAVNETESFEGKPHTGGVSAFAIDPRTSELKALNAQASEGASPCDIVVDPKGKHVLVANYSSGTVAVLPISADGRLSPASSVVQHQGKGKNPQRQEGPHAHSIGFDPTGRHVLSCDLGTDKVLVYKLDEATGKLTANDEPFASIEPGSGPRHFAFGANGRFLYVLNEMASTVTTLEYDGLRGAGKTLDTISTLPAGFQGENTTAEIAVHPSGRTLYASNRGHNSIAVFSIDPLGGKLTFVEHQSSGGKTPRGFAVDPTGAFLVCGNQDSDNLVVMRIDPETGKLKPTGHKVEVGAPVCVQILPPAAARQ